MRESQFQHKLIDDIKQMLPGCMVLKNDSGYIQGIPDLLVLFNDRWAALECKVSAESRDNPRPNQEYWVNEMNRMSFASFVFPENKKEVLHEMEHALRAGRSTCVPVSE